MTIHQVVFEFRVSRRIGWDGDGAEELREHFTAVCQGVAEAPNVERVHVKANLERARLEMLVDLEARTSFDAEVAAREALSGSIRASGATHIGLLSEADEARVGPRHRAVSALRTPQWVQHRAEVVG